jgi:hypothetical protein
MARYRKFRCSLSCGMVLICRIGRHFGALVSMSSRDARGVFVEKVNSQAERSDVRSMSTV